MTTSVSDGLTICAWKVAVATSGSCSQSTGSNTTRPMYSLCSRSMTRLAMARSSNTSPGEEMKNFRVFNIPSPRAQAPNPAQDSKVRGFSSSEAPRRCARSARRATPQPLEVTVAQLGLPRPHRNRLPPDEDALGERGDLERIPVPEDKIRRPTDFERPRPIRHAEDRRGVARHRRKRSFGRKPVRDRIAGGLADLANVVRLLVAEAEGHRYAGLLQASRILERRADLVETRRQVVERIQEHRHARRLELPCYQPRLRAAGDDGAELLSPRERDDPADIRRAVDVEHERRAALDELEQRLPAERRQQPLVARLQTLRRSRLEQRLLEQHVLRGAAAARQPVGIAAEIDEQCTPGGRDVAIERNDRALAGNDRAPGLIVRTRLRRGCEHRESHAPHTVDGDRSGIRIEGERHVELRAHLAERKRVVALGRLDTDLLDTEVTHTAEEPGRHDAACRVDDLGARWRGQVAADGRDPAVGDQQVTRDYAIRTDGVDGAAADEHARRRSRCRPQRRLRERRQDSRNRDRRWEPHGRAPTAVAA